MPTGLVEKLLRKVHLEMHRCILMMVVVPHTSPSSVPAELALCCTLRCSCPQTDTLTAAWHFHFQCGLHGTACLLDNIFESWEILSEDKRSKKVSLSVPWITFLRLCCIFLLYSFPLCILPASSISWMAELPNRSATSPVWQHICQSPASTAGLYLVGFPVRQTPVNHLSNSRSNVLRDCPELHGLDSYSFASSLTA